MLVARKVWQPISVRIPAVSARRRIILHTSDWIRELPVRLPDRSRVGPPDALRRSREGKPERLVATSWPPVTGDVFLCQRLAGASDAVLQLLKGFVFAGMNGD